MEEKFRNWLLQRGYSETGAVISYASAIHQISAHYSENTGEDTDVYSITDQTTISQIARDYSQSGKFSDFGYLQHGRYRAAISRYTEFFVHQHEILSNEPNDLTSSEVEPENSDASTQTNFAYEKDLQTALCAQISELFPGYKIFGDSNLGIEYSVGGRRIDVLLEKQDSNQLLVVELKSGSADYKVFGQISMYIGILQQQFPERSISGVIVAGAIDKSLRQACSTSEKVTMKMYRMSIELEDVEF